MPAPSWDSLVAETRAAARRRRRRRRQRAMLWLLTCVTTAVLVVIGVFVVKMATIPAAARPAALSASARTVSSATASRAARRVSPRGSGAPAAGPAQMVADTASGLSYLLLPSPWRRGCPLTLSTPAFTWTEGENALAGRVVIGGSTIDWHGLACSGLLQRQFAYSGPADLASAAMGVADAVDPTYYSGVPHHRALEQSSPMLVSGHQAWIVTFDMSYDAAASQGVTWAGELGAVVLVDRGPVQAPGMFYVSVPDNLGTGNVGVLVRSLSVPLSGRPAYRRSDPELRGSRSARHTVHRWPGKFRSSWARGVAA